MVWSRSDKGPDEPGRYREVGFTIQRSGTIVELHVGGQVLKTTAEHPFWVRDRGWVATENLQTGDELAGKDGEWTRVEAIVGTSDDVPVYNLHVPEDQTYFVGDETWTFAVWAHNTGADRECGIASNGSQEQQQAVANAPKSISTGRTAPNNLKEKLAMEEVMANPGGKQLSLKMSDTKNNLLAEDGWVKMVQNVNGVEIHYVKNTKTGQVLDFKFKD
jgi:intein/homing endonuclease